ncbi:transmembrane protein 222-like [Oppia nitens]|uniref:transmembrane protein 222-like n=1 Tax=Oppia nitens TaxID=1686743 RepID=UPI0023D9BF24|nr:transmembrane protein 222-like [Oppia nitens]
MKDNDQIMTNSDLTIDTVRHRYPYCIVWTPIPLLTWLVPVIGHMGICMSNGVIRDFAGPYYVSQDDMAFGNPTKYWQLSSKLLTGGHCWDDSVKQASDEYMNRMHSLCCDNCHSHVSMALNLMQYNGKCDYNMFNTFFRFTYHCKYVSFCAFLKTWLPFVVWILVLIVLVIYFQ